MSDVSRDVIFFPHWVKLRLGIRCQYSIACEALCLVHEMISAEWLCSLALEFSCSLRSVVMCCWLGSPPARNSVNMEDEFRQRRAVFDAPQ